MPDASRSGTARIELGRARLDRREADAVAPGSVIELDRAADDAVRVVVDGRVVAEGRLMVDGDELVVQVTRRF